VPGLNFAKALQTGIPKLLVLDMLSIQKTKEKHDKI
jgi:hypothetical protein